MANARRSRTIFRQNGLPVLCRSGTLLFFLVGITALIQAGAPFLFERSSLAAQSRADASETLTGTVVDVSSGAPVRDALVVVEAANGLPIESGSPGLRSLSAADGRFVLTSVPEGRMLIRVEHPAYGVHRRELQVEGSGTGSVEIILSPVAIELAPLLVEVDGSFGSSAAGNVIPRSVIDEARTRGLDLTDLLRRHVPGIDVRRPSGAGGDTCIEFRGARRGDGGCRPPALLLDGSPLSNPTALFATLSIGNLERIQVVPPAQAGTRFGMISGWGVILLTTRGSAASAAAALPVVRRSGPEQRQFEWSEQVEGEGYPWVRVYTGAFLGNALGMAAAGVLLSQCMDLGTRRFYREEDYCGWAPLLGSGIAAAILPPLGGSLAARFAGTTEHSRGSLRRSLAYSVPVVVPGLALANVNAGTAGLNAVELAGMAVIFLAAPALNTLADRAFRQPRR